MEKITAQVEVQVNRRILLACAEAPLSSAEIAAALGHKQLSGNLRKAFSELRKAGFLDKLGSHWGEVCGSAQTASRWADELLPNVHRCWDETRRGSYSYLNSTGACLSCLLSSGRHQELLDLLELAPHISWHYRYYGVQALVAVGKRGDAIKYAKASCGLNDSQIAIDQACERILLSSGLNEEAYLCML